jgi:hypothetical protein
MARRLRRNPASYGGSKGSTSSFSSGGSSDGTNWWLLGGLAVAAYLYYEYTQGSAATQAYNLANNPALPNNLDINQLLGVPSPNSISTPSQYLFTPSVMGSGGGNVRSINVPFNTSGSTPGGRAYNSIEEQTTLGVNSLQNGYSTPSTYEEATVTPQPFLSAPRLASPRMLSGLNPSRPNMSETFRVEVN